jgi:hypothetical protein
MTNEEKAVEIRSKLGIYADAYYGAMEMAQWKDEQLEKKIKKIKRDIVLSSDRKGGYEQNRVVEVDWVLRLIDEIMKGE